MCHFKFCDQGRVDIEKFFDILEFEYEHVMVAKKYLERSSLKHEENGVVYLYFEPFFENLFYGSEYN